VYYLQWSEGEVHLFKVPFAGGEGVQVSPLQINNISVSHAGDRILVEYFDEPSSLWKVGIISASDGKFLQTVDISLATQGFPMFQPDDKGVLFGETHNSVTNLWKMSLSGGSPVQFTHFSSEQIFNSVLTADGKLVMGRGHIQSDAILIKNFH